MSPTVRHDPPAYELDPTASHLASGAVAGWARVYAWGLLALAIVLVVALAITGEGFPEPGLLLLFALPLALCMNRYLIFVNEVGVTADAAVLFAAMVAFRGDAQWLGPLVLALLAGPLDARHWGARSFSRMAYNSGSTALVVGAGSAVFVSLSNALGTGWEATLAAAAIAAVPYVVAESVLGITLVTLLGEHPIDAARHQLPLNAIAFPLAVMGATAGLAAVGVGGWLAFLLLLPTSILPEIVFILVPQRTAASVRWVAAALIALVASVVLSSSWARGLSGIVALVCLVIADRRPATARARWFPPMLALVVTLPIAAFPIGLPTPTTAMLVASGAGAVVLFTLCGRKGRATAMWSLPVVALAACAAQLWSIAGRVGAVVFAAVMVSALLLAAGGGPPPWSSRVLARVPTRPVRRAIGVLAVAVAVCAVAATRAGGTAATDLGVVTTTLLEATVVIAAFTVHLWRFNPRRRARELAALLTVGAAGLVLVPELAPLVAVVGAIVMARLARVAPRSSWR